MSPTNREIQVQKTCELYAYLLELQGKEVSDDIQECAESYDYPIDCMAKLSEAIRALDSDSFKKIMKNTESTKALDLAKWWEMYQVYIPLEK